MEIRQVAINAFILTLAGATQHAAGRNERYVHTYRPYGRPPATNRLA